MDRRFTIALVAALFVLGGYIWYMFLRADAPPVNAPTPEPTPLAFLTVSPQGIRGIEVVENETGRRLRLVKANDQWQMEAPARGEAYAPQVESLVFQLGLIRSDRKLTSPASLADYGLAPARYEIRLELEDAGVQAVQLGGQNPDKNYYYAIKAGDDAVYLISSAVGDAIVDILAMPPFTRTPTVVLAPTLTPEPTFTPAR
jgi:hypothetical protein